MKRGRGVEDRSAVSARVNAASSSCLQAMGLSGGMAGRDGESGSPSGSPCGSFLGELIPLDEARYRRAVRAVSPMTLVWFDRGLKSTPGFLTCDGQPQYYCEVGVRVVLPIFPLCATLLSGRVLC